MREKVILTHPRFGPLDALLVVGHEPHVVKARGKLWGLMKTKFKLKYRIRLASRRLLLSASYATIGMLASIPETRAQSAQRDPDGSSLPPVTVTAPEIKRRTNAVPVQRANRSAERRRSQTARRPEPAAASKPFAA